MEKRGALIRQPRRRIQRARRTKDGKGSPDSHALTAFYLLLLFSIVADSSFPYSVTRETCMIGWPERRFISKPAFVGTRRAARRTSSSFFPSRPLSLRAQEKKGRERGGECARVCVWESEGERERERERERVCVCVCVWEQVSTSSVPSHTDRGSARPPPSLSAVCVCVSFTSVCVSIHIHLACHSHIHAHSFSHLNRLLELPTFSG